MGTIRNIKKKHLIYVVDDNIVFREFIKSKIEAIEDVDIKTFSSAESCLAEIEKKPSLIILDFYLDAVEPKNMNAHHAISKFNELKYPPKVVLISSETNYHLLQEYKDYRKIDFIIKADLPSSDIQKVVRRHLSISAAS